MSKTTEGRKAKDPPNLWKQIHAGAHRPEAIDSETVMAIVVQLAAKWQHCIGRVATGDIDALVESKVMYRLLSDQARMIAELIERIA